MAGLTARNGLAGIFLVLIAVMLAYWLAEENLYFSYKSPLLHFAIEAFSVIVSLAVAWLSFRSFRVTGSARVLVIGSAFLLMALLDFFHALSFAEMPATLLPIGTEVQLYYWIPSRLLGALLLLAGVVMPSKIIPDQNRSRMGSLALAAVVVFSLAWGAFAAIFYPSFPPLFIQGKGLTPIKIWAEYSAMALFALAVLACLRMFLRQGRELTYFIIIGLLLSVFSELSFTLYHDPWDVFVWLGHSLKILAFAAFGLGLARLFYSRSGA